MKFGRILLMGWTSLCVKIHTPLNREGGGNRSSTPAIYNFIYTLLALNFFPIHLTFRIFLPELIKIRRELFSKVQSKNFLGKH